MARKLKFDTQAQLDAALTAVRANPDQFSTQEKQMIQEAREEFESQQAAAGATPAAVGVEPQVGTPLAENFPFLPGMETADRAIQIARGFAQGLVSGGRDLVAGAQQAGLERLAEEGVGAEELAQLERERAGRKGMEEAQNRANLQALGLDPEGVSAFDVGEVTGSLAPEVAATLVTRRIPSGLARFVADSLVGTGNAFVQFVEPGGSRDANTLFGLGFGVGGGVIGGVNTGFRNFLTAETRAPVLMKEAREIDGIAKSMGFRDEASLLGSQAALSARLQTAERTLDLGIGSQRQQRLAAQTRQVVDNFTKTANTLDKANLSVGTVSKTLQDAVDSKIGNLKTLRSEQWKGTMELANTMTEGQPFIPAGSVRAKFNEILQRAEDPLFGLPVDSLPELRRRVNQINVLANSQNGMLSAQQMSDMLVNLTDEATGTGALLRDLGTSRARFAANELKAAALADLETAAGQGSPAAQLVAKARLDWNEMSKPIDELRGTAIDTIFNKAGFREGPAALDEGTFAQKILRLKPNEAKQLMGAIDDFDPLVADQMRAAVFRDMLEQHRTFAEGVPGQFDLKGFFNDLAGGRGKRSTMEVLFPDDEELQKGIKVLERLVFGQTGAVGVDTLQARVREAAVTLGSAAIGQQNAGFFARMFAGNIEASKMEQALFSPRALDEIRKLARPGKIDLGSQVFIDVLGNMAQNFQNLETDRNARDKRSEDLRRQQEAEAFQRAATPATSPAGGITF